MARRAVCGLWPDCNPCMNENGDCILILSPRPYPSLTVGGIGRNMLQINAFYGVMHWLLLAGMQDSVLYQSNYSPLLLLSFVGT